MIDIGCGTGFFAIPAARIVGPEGGVTAVDPSREMIETLQSRAKEAGIQVRTRCGRAGRIPLEDAGFTFALMANVLHEVEDPLQALREVLRILVPGGRIAIVEWKPDYPDGGPPPEHRISPDRIYTMLTETGFASVRECDAGEAHTGTVAIRGS